MPPWVTVKCLLSFLVTGGARRTVGHRNLRHLSCSLYAEIRQTTAHRASERSQGTLTRRRRRTTVPQHVRIQRCKQQVDAKLVESSPVRRGVCSWQGQSCNVLERHRLGFGTHCTRAAVAANRITVLGACERRNFVQIESDTRHVELILDSLGLLDGIESCRHQGPHTDDQVERRQVEAYLFPKLTTVFRSFVMRASCLSQGLADLGEAVQSLAGRPSWALRFEAAIASKHQCLSRTVILQPIVQHANQQLRWFRGLGDIRMEQLRTCRHHLVST